MLSMKITLKSIRNQYLIRKQNRFVYSKLRTTTEVEWWIFYLEKIIKDKYILHKYFLPLIYFCRQSNAEEKKIILVTQNGKFNICRKAKNIFNKGLC